MPDVIVQGMEMPKNCLLCPFCVPEGDVDNGEMCVISGQFPLVNKQERSVECPLKEHETTDRIMLRGAIEGPAVWSVVAALDPERPIVVRMTYADLYAIAKMIQERGDKDRSPSSY